MSTLDVTGYLDDGALDLTGVASKRYPDGHTYRVESPSWPDALRLRRVVGRWGGMLPDKDDGVGDDADVAALEGLLHDADGRAVSLHEKVLGTALDEMVGDGVPPIAIDRILTLVLLHYGMNEHVAVNFLAAAKGEAQARTNRATRRAAAKKAPAKPRGSSKPAGSKSSPASSVSSTPRTKAPASTRGRGTSATPPRARKAG
jgi:hypothetical protein